MGAGRLPRPVPAPPSRSEATSSSSATSSRARSTLSATAGWRSPTSGVRFRRTARRSPSERRWWASWSAGRSRSAVAGATKPARLELDQGTRHASDPEQAGADVGADHRANLRGEYGVGAEDLLPLGDQPLGGLRVLDVLDDPGVGAGLVPLARVADHPFEGTGAGPDA